MSGSVILNLKITNQAKTNLPIQIFSMDEISSSWRRLWRAEIDAKKGMSSVGYSYSLYFCLSYYLRSQMLKIPPHFFEVPYNDSHYPDAPKTNGLEGGANCQVFIYELLKYHGVTLPPFRSSDLWEDEIYTEKVSDFQPLDILLWNNSPKSWGAHVGLYIGGNQVIHLAKAQKFAVIWDVEEFTQHEIYSTFIGAKRVKTVKTVKTIWHHQQSWEWF